ncbi:MAG: FAD-dependent oxidoreductase [Candidatus Moranbacteria bacterium]|nr:FAD-dependent oxidoreductase [Candidatus Moranbacteria bacterium]
MAMEKENKIYDLIIIGAGAAGLTASLYASRYKLDHLIFGMEPGGQINEIHSLENWPGVVSIQGKELIGRMVEQVNNFGVQIKGESINSVQKNAADIFEIGSGKEKYLAKTLIMAMGASYRKMNIPGEKEFTGKGVSYCATCDAMFFRNKVVSVIGGGNSAAVVALELTDFASKVYLVYRGEKLSAEPVWLDRLAANPKIEIIKKANVIEIKGDVKVERIILDRALENDKTFLPVDGVFIEIGSEPGIELARKLGVETDEQNFIKVGADQSTNVLGVFAAGDITTGSNKFRQIIMAAAEGALAANSAYKKLKV